MRISSHVGSALTQALTSALTLNTRWGGAQAGPGKKSVLTAKKYSWHDGERLRGLRAERGVGRVKDRRFSSTR